MTVIPKIDVHHHIVPPQIAEDNSHGLSSMKPPKWDLSSDWEFCQSVNINARIFSVSVPGVLHIKDPKESAVLAREMNEYCAGIRDQNPNSCGFFATVPSLEHTELVLQEVRYALDTLHADGITMFTSYATPEGYLGHPEYEPIWEELNKRAAVVFVHPADNKALVRWHERLAAPAFDWPHETGRTAMDMILNRIPQRFPNVKIILSHGGGTLAALVERVTMVELPEFGTLMTREDILQQARSFYFDLALSGSNEMFPLISGFAAEGHLLYGSDWPHATTSGSQKHTRFIDEYPLEEKKRKELYYEAALALFPRLKGAFPSIG